MYDSSLSEELSAFDFTGVANVRSSSSSFSSAFSSPQGMSLSATSGAMPSLRSKSSSFYMSRSFASGDSASASSVVAEANEPIEAELDELNGHESMGSSSSCSRWSRTR